MNGLAAARPTPTSSAGGAAEPRSAATASMRSAISESTRLPRALVAASCAANFASSAAIALTMSCESTGMGRQTRGLDPRRWMWIVG